MISAFPGKFDAEAAGEPVHRIGFPLHEKILDLGLPQCGQDHEPALHVLLLRALVDIERRGRVIIRIEEDRLLGCGDMEQCRRRVLGLVQEPNQGSGDGADQHAQQDRRQPVATEGVQARQNAASRQQRGVRCQGGPPHHFQARRQIFVQRRQQQRVGTGSGFRRLVVRWHQGSLHSKCQDRLRRVLLFSPIPRPAIPKGKGAEIAG